MNQASIWEAVAGEGKGLGVGVGLGVGRRVGVGVGVGVGIGVGVGVGEGNGVATVVIDNTCTFAGCSSTRGEMMGGGRNATYPKLAVATITVAITPPNNLVIL